MWLDAGLMKIMLSYAMLLLTIDPTFISNRSGILEFRFWI